MQHGPEFDHLKRLAVSTRAGLAEEDGGPQPANNQQRYEENYRG